MSAVRRNIVSNLLASVWVTGLTIAITPLQVNLLGIEAYGLIGFIATLQIIFAMFDLGLSSTLTRQIASDHSPGHTDSNELIRTAMTLYWAFSAAVGTCLALSAGFIATHWFSAKSLSTRDVEHALYAITVYLAARWPVALYSGVLSGLQRMDVLNVVKTATSTLRLVGGIGLLLVWPDLNIFLWWTAANAVLEICAYILACRRTSGIANWRFALSVRALKSVWGFSLSMSAISMLALLISQLDRLMLSKMLSLTDLGYYTLAYNTASTVSLAISAVSAAMLPAFAEADSLGAKDVLSSRYGQANRVILFVVGLAAFPLMFDGDVILGAWVGPASAAGASRILGLLALGFWFSAALSNAYSVTIATGRPGLTLRLSALSAIPYAAALYLLLRHFGKEGAAWAWMMLNLTYLVILVPMVHRELLDVSTRQWLLRTLLPFGLLGCASFLAPRWTFDHLRDTPSAAWEFAGMAVGVVIYGSLGFLLLGPVIQAQLLKLLGLDGKHAVPLRP